MSETPLQNRTCFGALRTGNRATGEHWYGQQAVEKGLVDEINTSDEVILSLMEGREVVNVRYMQRKRLIDRFTGSAAESADRLLLRWWQRGQKPLM